MNFIKQEAVNLQSKEASHTWEGAGSIAERGLIAFNVNVSCYQALLWQNPDIFHVWQHLCQNVGQSRNLGQKQPFKLSALSAEQNFQSGMILLLCKSCSNGDNHSSLQNSSVSLNNFRAQVSIFLHPVSLQLLRITHITSSTYQTVKCAVFTRRLRVIIKTVVPQCSTNKIKICDQSRHGLSKQAHHCKQVTMAPNLLWSKTALNNVHLEVFHLSPSSSVSCHRAANKAKAVDFHECSLTWSIQWF